ncbi:hypothetical protein JCM1840_007036 [Sporobolomyces johnsonii]
MNVSRICITCVRSARPALRPTAALPRLTPSPRSLHAFAPSAPLLKKQAKQRQDAFEEEFEEDVIDDVDEPAPSLSPSGPAGSGTRGDHRPRAEKYAEELSRVENILAQPTFSLASHRPSIRLLTRLIWYTSPATLSQTLEIVAKWRHKGLPVLNEAAVTALINRLSELPNEERAKAVEVLADRTKYNIDITHVRFLHSLFAKFSQPVPVVAAAVAEGADAASASDDAAAFTQQANLCFDLLALARQHTPTTVATDPLALLTTLSAAFKAGEWDTPRVNELVAQVQRIGEAGLVQKMQKDMGKAKRTIVRYRAMRIATLMREKGHGELEWFAHLAETLERLNQK